MKKVFYIATLLFSAILLQGQFTPPPSSNTPVMADADGVLVSPLNFWEANKAAIEEAAKEERLYPVFEIPVPWNSGFTDFELKGSTNNFLAAANGDDGDLYAFGAGSPYANGVYEPYAVVNGRPYYTAPWDMYMAWSGSDWRITEHNPGGLEAYYFSTDDVPTPNLATTWQVGVGSAPAPTVTLAGTQLTYYFHSPAPIGQPGAPGGQVYSHEPVVYFTDSGYSDPRRNRASNNEDSIADQLTDVNSEVGSITVILVPGESDDWLSPDDARLTWTYHLMDGTSRDEDPSNRSIWRTIQPVRWLTEAEFQAQSKLPQ